MMIGDGAMNSHSPALFVADAPGLDFLNSVATPTDSRIDWIADGEGLLSWLDQAGMVPAGVLNGMRADALPGELDKVADQARTLREWFRGFVHTHKGTPITPEALGALDPLNRLLERDEAFSRISLDHGALTLRAARRWRSPESLLLPIGEALAHLVCEEDFTRVRACEGHECTLLFADHTRGHARRWCSMGMCGNRAKQAAHRLRAKKG